MDKFKNMKLPRLHKSILTKVANISVVIVGDLNLVHLAHTSGCQILHLK